MIAGLVLAMVMGGCATGQPRGWVDVSAWGANYTEDYIYEYWIKTIEDKRTGVGGVHVNEFSRGGTSGTICCALMPGVGQTIKVVWRIGGYREDESQWKTYSRDVVVKGTMPVRTKRHSYLVVRFFSDHEVEAELVPSADIDPKNPRVDKLFSGQRVMRQKGE
ncbi:Protein of unknown function [Cupriavidus sp. YR651]|uniref:DUF3304 domain-containing protein n=1 Tax=Cupriavidus sp. YR651 TaxID=1855315 RepID=UPI000880D262|nr:DUF3304 domain-containing protein [Cupriavidus sp. YR651]SDB98947.1 Protein of unknown function [Cupriavidus sp. YR651]